MTLPGDRIIFFCLLLSLTVVRLAHAQEDDNPVAVPQPAQFAPPPPDFDEDEFEEVDPDGTGVARPAPLPGGANPIPGNMPNEGGGGFNPGSGGSRRFGGGNGSSGDKVKFQVVEGEYFEKGKRRGRAFDPLEKHERNR
jgi:hypothetical protein